MTADAAEGRPRGDEVGDRTGEVDDEEDRVDPAEGARPRPLAHEVAHAVDHRGERQNFGGADARLVVDELAQQEVRPGRVALRPGGEGGDQGAQPGGVVARTRDGPRDDPVEVAGDALQHRPVEHLLARVVVQEAGGRHLELGREVADAGAPEAALGEEALPDVHRPLPGVLAACGELSGFHNPTDRTVV